MQEDQSILGADTVDRLKRPGVGGHGRRAVSHDDAIVTMISDDLHANWRSLERSTPIDDGALMRAVQLIFEQRNVAKRQAQHADEGLETRVGLLYREETIRFSERR